MYGQKIYPLLLADREVGFDGIHCRHGRRTVAAWANEIADLRARQSRNAIDRRNDPRETEVELGSCLSSFGSLDGGFRRFDFRPGSRDRGPRGEIGLDGIVEFLGRDGACLHRIRAALSDKQSKAEKADLL